MCVPVSKYEMLGLAAKYGTRDVIGGLSANNNNNNNDTESMLPPTKDRQPAIKDTVWSCFVRKVQL